MSRSTYAPKQIYTGNNLLAVYTFDFKIEALTQLEFVVVDELDVETERDDGTNVAYLSGVVFDAVDGGGTVTLTANLPTGHRLILMLANDEPTQPFEFKNKGTFTLPQFERSNDFIAGSVQRLSYQAKQAFRLHDLDDETAFDAMLPPRIDLNPETMLMIDVNGTKLTYGPTKADLDATLAAAAAALVSEQNAATSAAAALVSELAALVSELAAAQSAVDAAQSAVDAAASVAGIGDDVIDAEAAAAAALVSQTAAGVSEGNALTSETNAATSETNAATSEANALVSELAAAASAAAALVSELAAAQSAIDAAASAALASLVETFATESIAAAAEVTHNDHLRQYRRVESATAGAIELAAAPFGIVPTLFADGMEIQIVGTDNTKTVQINRADIQYGALTNGDLILGLGMSVTLAYDATLERWISRNYF